MVQVEVSGEIPVPSEKLFSLMSDYNNWPKLFSAHTSVRLIKKEGDVEYIELGDRRYGKVNETHRVIPPNRIDIEEFTPGWDGTFVNLFESLPNGNTELTVKVDIKGKGLMKLVGPFAGSYVRNRVRKQIFEELQKTAPASRT